jgi:adenylate kinase family enzyme
MQRVVIVGTSGAGKTTLGKRLAKKLEARFIELDALHWQENWTPNPNFAAAVAKALEAERWVVDGNYSSKLQDSVLEQADTLIWLDYSLGTKLWRLIRRSVRRVVTREVLWNGNTETLRTMAFSRDSLFIWFFKSHWKQRRRYAALFAAAPEGLSLYRLTRPEEARVLLERRP